MSGPAGNSEGGEHILAPVSFGEVADKVTILRLKESFVRETEKRAFILAELAILSRILEENLRRRDSAEIQSGIAALAAANRALWDIENALRAHEARQDFGPGFIALARSVYTRNDERAAIKARLNALFGSRLAEVKSYGGSA